MITFIDAETSTKNKGHPHDPENFLVSYAYSQGGDTVVFKYYTDPDFITCLKSVLANATVLVGFNIKFDLHWFHRVGVSYRGEVYDCSLGEFILSGQRSGFISLNEALESYGLPTKSDVVASYWEAGISTENIPVPILKEYNSWDITTTTLLYYTQQKLLSRSQQTLLMLEGRDLKALQHAEAHGIKWDQIKAEAKLVECREKRVRIEARLNDYLGPMPEHFVFNWDSGDHLSAFLYGGVISYDYSIPEEAVYKSGPNKGLQYTKNRWYSEKINFKQRFIPLEGTEVAKTAKLEDIPGQPKVQRFYQVDSPTLKQLKGNKANKEVLAFLDERSKTIKVEEMVESIMKKKTEMNWQDNFLHPQFNQNAVVTGRLSSSAPNMQNTPPEVDELLVSRYDN